MLLPTVARKTKPNSFTRVILSVLAKSKLSYVENFDDVDPLTDKFCTEEQDLLSEKLRVCGHPRTRKNKSMKRNEILSPQPSPWRRGQCLHAKELSGQIQVASGHECSASGPLRSSEPTWDRLSSWSLRMAQGHAQRRQTNHKSYHLPTNKIQKETLANRQAYARTMHTNTTLWTEGPDCLVATCAMVCLLRDTI